MGPRAMIRIAIALLAAAASLGASSASWSTASAPSEAIEIQTEDVERFYRVYEAAGGRPTAGQLQNGYLDPGTAGLRHLTQVRNVTAENIAKAVATRPALYTNARACLAALPRIRERLDRTFDRLLGLYPEAAKPPVTILVSRGKPIAIAGPGHGVQIALEGMCSEIAARFLGASIDDRFVNVIAHEYIHVQQAPEQANPTVLQRALNEGVAEFVGELISGGVANVAVHASAKGRELEIETRFAADLDKTDLSAWFDNSTAEDVGQLGYWVGYRIAKSYYLNAPDKRAAIRELIRAADPYAILARSGWRPGVVLNDRDAPVAAAALPQDAPFRAEIERFAQIDRIQTPPACAVLFVGSSSIRLWQNLRADMVPLPVINRGFGGSTIAQANRYFDRIVTPYRPRAIVVYSGENDIDGGVAPAEAIEAFRRFMAMKVERLGDTPVFYISAKPSKLRIAQLPRQTELNRGVEAMAKERTDLHFIDIVPAMLENGVPRDLYVEDGLHMSPAGYAIWRGKVMAALRQAGIPARNCP